MIKGIAGGILDKALNLEPEETENSSSEDESTNEESSTTEENN